MTVWSNPIYCNINPWLHDDSGKNSVDSSHRCYTYTVPSSDNSIFDDSSLSDNSSLSTISLDSLDDERLCDDCLSMDSLHLDDNESDDSDSVPLLISQLIQLSGMAWSKRKMETTSCFQDLIDLEFLYITASKYKNDP